jgi:hypothetical protein
VNLSKNTEKGDERGRRVARKHYEECYGSLSRDRLVAGKHYIQEAFVTSKGNLLENIETL